MQADRVSVLFVRITFAVAALLPACSATARSDDACKPSESLRKSTIDFVQSDLRAMRADTASRLIETAPTRELVMIDVDESCENSSISVSIGLGLAPGKPGYLPVPTGLLSQYYSLIVYYDDHLEIFRRPTRDNLKQAVSKVISDEEAALESASKALTDANVPLPEGRMSWRDAAVYASYDARLPRNEYCCEPGWQFLFEPWSQEGWNSIQLDGTLAPTSINGMWKPSN